MADKFDEAVETVNGLPKDGPVKPSDDDRLYFYAYYKQATIGDVNTTRPTGFLDFVGKAKWDAWNGVKKGTTSEEAKEAYVKKLIEMVEGSESEEAKTILLKLKPVAA